MIKKIALALSTALILTGATEQSQDDSIVYIDLPIFSEDYDVEDNEIFNDLRVLDDGRLSCARLSPPPALRGPNWLSGSIGGA